jgi:hypothetical protein
VASVAAPGAPSTLNVVADNVAEQVSKVAAAITARMALGAAAWDLVRTGICFQVGDAELHEIGWNYTTGRSSAGLNWRRRFVFLCPQFICRAAWQDTPSELMDSVLYLQLLAPDALSSGVAEALSMSLQCFHRELYIPCIAMLGSGRIKSGNPGMFFTGCDGQLFQTITRRSRCC